MSDVADEPRRLCAPVRAGHMPSEYIVEIVFGVSDSDWLLYDLYHGRKVIGYDPQDRSIVPDEERE